MSYFPTGVESQRFKCERSFTDLFDLMSYSYFDGIEVFSSLVVLAIEQLYHSLCFHTYALPAAVQAMSRLYSTAVK